MSEQELIQAMMDGGRAAAAQELSQTFVKYHRIIWELTDMVNEGEAQVVKLKAELEAAMKLIPPPAPEPTQLNPPTYEELPVAQEPSPVELPPATTEVIQ